MSEGMFCFPACIPCGEAGHCPKAGEILARRVKRAPVVRDWRPNNEPSVKLPCQHVKTAWPLVRAGGVDWIYCDECDVKYDYNAIQGKQKDGKRPRKPKPQPVQAQNEQLDIPPF